MMYVEGREIMPDKIYHLSDAFKKTNEVIELESEIMRLMNIFDNIERFNEDCPYANHPSIYMAVRIAREGGECGDLGNGLGV